MGYSTDFVGEFQLDKTLSPEHLAYLIQFSEIRHVKRDPNRLESTPDKLHVLVGLPLGHDGEFYVEDEHKGVLDNNHQPSTQPGLWCQWVPDGTGDAITWDGGEKFYSYTEWIKYIIKNFLDPWGYKLNGTVEWSGEEHGDVGVIKIVDNVVTIGRGRIVFD